MHDTRSKGKTYTVWGKRSIEDCGYYVLCHESIKEEHFDTIEEVVQRVTDASEYNWNRVNDPFWQVGTRFGERVIHKTREHTYVKRGSWKRTTTIVGKEVDVRFVIKDNFGKLILKSELNEVRNYGRLEYNMFRGYWSWNRETGRGASPKRKRMGSTVSYGKVGIGNKKRLEAAKYQEPHGEIDCGIGCDICDEAFKDNTFNLEWKKVKFRKKADNVRRCWDDRHSKGQICGWKTKRKTQYRVKGL